MDSAKAIRHALAHTGQKQAWLAKQLKVTAPYITALIKGNETPSIEMFQRIADATGVKFSQMAKWGEE